MFKNVEQQNLRDRQHQ